MIFVLKIILLLGKHNGSVVYPTGRDIFCLLLTRHTGTYLVSMKVITKYERFFQNGWKNGTERNRTVTERYQKVIPFRSVFFHSVLFLLVFYLKFWPKNRTVTATERNDIVKKFRSVPFISIFWQNRSCLVITCSQIS